MPSSSNDPKKRQRRDQRPTVPPPMRETERDRAIVQLLYQYRILSQEQFQRLLGKSRSTVQQALVRLYHHQYLDRVFMPIARFGSSPTLYVLGKQGIETLRRLGIEDFAGIPDKSVSGMFLEHTMAINEVRIAITQACASVGWEVLVWKTENEIKTDYDKVEVKTKQGKLYQLPIVPDGYFALRIPDRGVSHFFLELDRGKMPLKRFRNKVIGYIAYYKQRAYERRYHAKGFRVLTIVDTPTTARLNNLAKSTAQVNGIGRRFWFAHLPNITPEQVLHEAIWTVAGGQESEALFKLV